MRIYYHSGKNLCGMNIRLFNTSHKLALTIVDVPALVNPALVGSAPVIDVGVSGRAFGLDRARVVARGVVDVLGFLGLGQAKAGKEKDGQGQEGGLHGPTYRPCQSGFHGQGNHPG